MDDEGAGAGHQGTLPCRGSLRQNHERRLAVVRLPEVSVANGSEVGRLYALFGGPEEEEVRIKGQRLAKAWLAKAHNSIEEARKCMGLQLRRASKLNVARQCRHDGPPTESRPCEGQAQAAIQRADCAWESEPRRMRELCGECLDKAGWPTGGSAPVKAPDGGSEFSPGSSDSESDTDFSESCDSGSSDPETRDSEPQEAESEGLWAARGRARGLRVIRN